MSVSPWDIYDLCMTLTFWFNIKIIFSPWICVWKKIVVTLWHRHAKFCTCVYHYKTIYCVHIHDLFMTLTYDLYVGGGDFFSKFNSKIFILLNHKLCCCWYWFLYDYDVLVPTFLFRIQGHKTDSWNVQEIYVDETQDFTQAELYLLLRICKNPNNMFLTGDTAQSIMRGISFRFKDLSSLFYHASQKVKDVKIPEKVMMQCDTETKFLHRPSFKSVIRF